MASSASGDEAARPADGEEVESSQGSQASGERRGWTEEEWRLWNSGLWRSQDGASSPNDMEYQDHGTEVGGAWWSADQGRRQSSSWWSSTASPGDEPWNRWNDPWSKHETWSASDRGWRGSSDGGEHRGGAGGQDKIVIPEFTAEEDRDGGKAKSYLRKIEAWRRVTRLPPQKQAVMLYNGLAGKAWRDAEELDLTILDAANGVDKFIAWIAERYLDKEVVKAGKYMSDFFKTFKKTADQDIRDYNMEFDQHLAKLKEVGCPRQIELGQCGRVALALCTEVEDAPEEDDAMDDIDDNGGDDGYDEADLEAHEAFVAFQNAKAKYNDVLKARGTNTGSREESLARAKARSYCSACGKKGHWHRDPDCPKNKAKANVTTPHTTHLVYYTDGDPLDVIVDCACSRTLAGSTWIRSYIDLLEQYQIDYIMVEQDEAFKFGGPKIYPSKKAVVGWL